MAFGKLSRHFERALSKAGERVVLLIDGDVVRTRAIVQNAGKNFMRKYDNEGATVSQLGRSRSRDKVAFLPYFKGWEIADDLALIWRGRKYEVISDSVMVIGNSPVYIWALLAEVAPGRNSNYYDDFKPPRQLTLGECEHEHE